MSQIYEMTASKIMQECGQTLKKQKNSRQNQFSLSRKSNKNNNNINIKQHFNPFDLSLNPVEQAEKNKIIQKLKKKHNKKKQGKQIFIRKSELGENQSIFNKEELKKLKQTDDQEIYRTSYPKSNSASPILQFSQDQSNKNKYFDTFCPQNQHQQIQKYLDWVDLKQFKSNSQINKKKKVLNFQKRQKFSSPTPSKKISSPLPQLFSKNSPSSRKEEQLQLRISQSSYPLLKKNSADKGFLNSLRSNQKSTVTLNQKQKMSMILRSVNQKIEKQFTHNESSKKYIYMTGQRKQALFECEVLRTIKKQFGLKFYKNLQITSGSGQKLNITENEGEDKENNERLNQITKRSKWQRRSSNKGFKRNGVDIENQRDHQTSPQKMIQKYLNRLNDEKKRVIQKMSC